MNNTDQNQDQQQQHLVWILSDQNTDQNPQITYQIQENQQNTISTTINIPSLQTLEMQNCQQPPPLMDPFLGISPPPPPPPPQQPIYPWNIPTADPFLLPSSSSSYAGLFTRRPSNSLQFTYDGTMLPLGLQAELNKMSAQEIMDAKALAASKSHSEAERRRRERINNHLVKLRSLLPSTTKTDKASLLAEVIQHVKELRRQTTAIAETTTVPTETDELTVDTTSDDQDGKLIIKASLCCDDRPDLLPDLIKTLKTLRLKTLKAEISTLGGRVKNILFITHDNRNEEGDNNNEQQPEYSIDAVEEALRAVMEKSGEESTSTGNAKRQRTASINISS